MASPFALNRITEESNISTDRARDDYFKSESAKATKYLADEADRLAKQKKVHGIFGKHDWLKTALTIGANVVMPGIGGVIASGALSAADSLKKDKDIKSQIAGANNLASIPARFKGTFMEDYISGGISSARAQKVAQLKSARKAQQMMGALDLGLSVIPGLGRVSKYGLDGVGKKAAADVLTKEGVEKATKKSIGNFLKEKTKSMGNFLKEKALKTVKPDNLKYLDKISGAPLNKIFSNIDTSILDALANKGTETGTQTVIDEAIKDTNNNIIEAQAQSALNNFGQSAAKKLGKTITDLIPKGEILAGSLYTGQTDDIKGRLFQELLRPSTFRNEGANLYQKLNSSSEEPTVSRLDARYRRRR